jgi:Rod binding domain-containing protein
MANTGIQTPNTAASQTALYNLRAPSGMERLGKAQSPDKIREAAVEFEGVFMSQMFSEMSAGLDVDPVFGGGRGEEMFRGMLTQEYGKMMARSQSGIGLADAIQKAMIDAQSSAGKGSVTP